MQDRASTGFTPWEPTIALSMDSAGPDGLPHPPPPPRQIYTPGCGTDTIGLSITYTLSLN